MLCHDKNLRNDDYYPNRRRHVKAKVAKPLFLKQVTMQGPKSASSSNRFKIAHSAAHAPRAAALENYGHLCYKRRNNMSSWTNHF